MEASGSGRKTNVDRIQSLIQNHMLHARSECDREQRIAVHKSDQEEEEARMVVLSL